MTFWIVSAWSQVFHSWVLQCSLTQPQLVFQTSLKVSTLKKQWDRADCTLVQNWFWDYDSTTAGLLMNWLWRNQLMFNHTQRSAATHLNQLMFNHTQRSAATTLETGHQSFSCLSTSFGSVASFSGYTVKKYPSPNMIYQKNTCCTSVCRHPQTFYWILYSTMQPKLPESKTFPPLKSSFYWTFPRQQQVLLKRKPTTPSWCSCPNILFLLYRLHPSPWIDYGV